MEATGDGQSLRDATTERDECVGWVGGRTAYHNIWDYPSWRGSCLGWGGREGEGGGGEGEREKGGREGERGRVGGREGERGREGGWEGGREREGGREGGREGERGREGGREGEREREGGREGRTDRGKGGVQERMPQRQKLCCLSVKYHRVDALRTYLGENSHIFWADPKCVPEALHTILQLTDLVQHPLLSLLQVRESRAHNLMEHRHTPQAQRRGGEKMEKGREKGWKRGREGGREGGKREGC